MPPLLAAMRELSARYPRFGYRRIRVFLKRQGLAMSDERAHRLWRQAGLQVPRRRPRKRIASAPPRPLPASAMNHLWAYDFVFDACGNGEQLKCLTGGRRVDPRVPGHRCRWQHPLRPCRIAAVAIIVSLLRSLAKLQHDPFDGGRSWRSWFQRYYGPEFVATAAPRWLLEAGIEWAHTDPGKPRQNGTDESFNGKFRDACLGLEWFRSRAEAKVLIETWRRHYNEQRPHSTLSYLTPSAFREQHLSSVRPSEASLK